MNQQPPFEIHVGDAVEIHPVGDEEGSQVLAEIDPDRWLLRRERVDLGEFIVRACNNHDRLLAACKVAVEILDHDETCDLLHAAIAAAEEEP